MGKSKQTWPASGLRFVTTPHFFIGLPVTNFRAISHIGRQRHKLTAVPAERALAAVFTHDCGRGERKKYKSYACKNESRT